MPVTPVTPVTPPFSLSKNCEYRTLIEEYLTGKETHFKEISEYEANRRGFFKCPECYDSRSALYEIESDIESLKDSVYDLYPLVIE